MQLARRDIEIGLRLGSGYPALQPRDRTEDTESRILLHSRERRADGGPDRHVAREIELRTRDADDCGVAAAHPYRSPEHREIAAEACAPQPVAEYDAARRPGAVVFIVEETAGERRSAEHLEEVAGDGCAIHMLGLRAGEKRIVQVHGGGERDVVECRVRLAPLPPVRIGHFHMLLAVRLVGQPEGDDARRIVEADGPQEHR